MGRDGAWASLLTRIGPDSQPRCIDPIVHEPGATITCVRCDARARYHDFLPPWPDAGPGAGACDVPFCTCPLPLTPADRAEEAQFMGRLVRGRPRPPEHRTQRDLSPADPRWLDRVARRFLVAASGPAERDPTHPPATLRRRPRHGDQPLSWSIEWRAR